MAKRISRALFFAAFLLSAKIFADDREGSTEVETPVTLPRRILPPLSWDALQQEDADYLVNQAFADVFGVQSTSGSNQSLVEGSGFVRIGSFLKPEQLREFKQRLSSHVRLFLNHQRPGVADSQLLNSEENFTDTFARKHLGFWKSDPESAAVTQQLRGLVNALKQSQSSLWTKADAKPLIKFDWKALAEGDPKVMAQKAQIGLYASRQARLIAQLNKLYEIEKKLTPGSKRYQDLQDGILQYENRLADAQMGEKSARASYESARDSTAANMEATANDGRKKDQGDAAASLDAVRKRSEDLCDEIVHLYWDQMDFIRGRITFEDADGKLRDFADPSARSLVHLQDNRLYLTDAQGNRKAFLYALPTDPKPVDKIHDIMALLPGHEDNLVSNQILSRAQREQGLYAPETMRERSLGQAFRTAVDLSIRLNQVKPANGKVNPQSLRAIAENTEKQLETQSVENMFHQEGTAYLKASPIREEYLLPLLNWLGVYPDCFRERDEEAAESANKFEEKLGLILHDPAPSDTVNDELGTYFRYQDGKGKAPFSSNKDFDYITNYKGLIVRDNDQEKSKLPRIFLLSDLDSDVPHTNFVPQTDAKKLPSDLTLNWNNIIAERLPDGRRIMRLPVPAGYRLKSYEVTNVRAKDFGFQILENVSQSSAYVLFDNAFEPLSHLLNLELVYEALPPGKRTANGSSFHCNPEKAASIAKYLRKTGKDKEASDFIALAKKNPSQYDIEKFFFDRAKAGQNADLTNTVSWALNTLNDNPNFHAHPRVALEIQQLDQYTSRLSELPHFVVAQSNDDGLVAIKELHKAPAEDQNPTSLLEKIPPLDARTASGLKLNIKLQDSDYRPFIVKNLKALSIATFSAASALVLPFLGADHLPSPADLHLPSFSLSSTSPQSGHKAFSTSTDDVEKKLGTHGLGPNGEDVPEITNGFHVRSEDDFRPGFYSIGGSADYEKSGQPVQVSSALSANPQMQVDSEVQVKASNGFLPLPTPMNGELSALVVRDAEGINVPVEKYSVTFDPVTHSYAAKIGNGTYTMTEEFRKVSEAPAKVNSIAAELSRLDPVKIQALAYQLEDAGFSQLSQALLMKAHSGQPITTESVIKDFQEAAFFTLARPSESIEEVRELHPTNVFAVFRGYLTNGHMCANCGVENLMAATFFQRYFENNPQVHVDVKTVLIAQEGGSEIAIYPPHGIMQIRIKEEDGTSLTREFDATASARATGLMKRLLEMRDDDAKEKDRQQHTQREIAEQSRRRSEDEHEENSATRKYSEVVGGPDPKNRSNQAPDSQQRITASNSDTKVLLASVPAAATTPAVLGQTSANADYQSFLNLEGTNSRFQNYLDEARLRPLFERECSKNSAAQFIKNIYGLYGMLGDFEKGAISWPQLAASAQNVLGGHIASAADLKNALTDYAKRCESLYQKILSDPTLAKKSELFKGRLFLSEIPAYISGLKRFANAVGDRAWLNRSVAKGCKGRLSDGLGY